MKILVVSDSHGEKKNIEKMYKKEKPEMVIFAGDGAEDFEELSYCHPESTFVGVKGNMDFDYNMSIRETIEIYGKTIFITHGHMYDAKRSYSHLLAEGDKIGASIVIFGHTHEQLCESFNGIRLFNPGSVKDGNYGIMTADGDGIKLYTKHL